MDFAGKTLGEMSVPVALNPGESRRCLDQTPLRSVVLRSQYLTAEFNGLTAIHLVEAERYLHLPKSKLTVRKASGGIEISTTVYARQVAIEASGVTGAMFDDNHFDMLPGQTRVVKILESAGADAVRVKAVNSEAVRLDL